MDLFFHMQLWLWSTYGRRRKCHFKFVNNLCKKPTSDMDELRQRTTKSMHMEELTKYENQVQAKATRKSASPTLTRLWRKDEGIDRLENLVTPINPPYHKQISHPELSLVHQNSSHTKQNQHSVQDWFLKTMLVLSQPRIIKPYSAVSWRTK